MKFRNSSTKWGEFQPQHTVNTTLIISLPLPQFILPFAILSLAKFVDDQNENEFFGTGRVGMGKRFEVVPSVRGALESKHQVPTVHHRDVLIVVECSVEAIGCEVSEN